MATESKVPRLMESAEDGAGEVTHTLEDTEDMVLRYSALFRQERFSDIVLRVGDHRYHAHRFVLITASSVFEAMLSERRWKEARQPEVFLNEEDECVDQFEQFLGYLYSGKAVLKTTTVLPLLLLADKYEVSCLRRSCLQFMTDHIVQSPDTNRALTWYQYAQMTGQTALRDKCLSFILSNFDTVMRAGDWPGMLLEELTGFLASSDVVVESEASLWNCVEAWLLHENNKYSLEDNLGEVLPLLRFTMMPPKLLVAVEKSSLYADYKQLFADKLNHAFRRHSLALEEPGEPGSDDELKGREEYRSYTSDDYLVANTFSLLSYPAMNKIDTRVSLDCHARHRFVSSSRLNLKQEDQTLFSVYFFPRGYFTTLSLYHSYMGRQSNDVTLKVIRRRPDTEPMKVDVTLMLEGKANDLKYAAFTQTWSFTFAKDKHTLSVDKFLDMDRLMEDNSPYLLDGALVGTVFLKIQDIGPHLVEVKDEKS